MGFKKRKIYKDNKKNPGVVLGFPNSVAVIKSNPGETGCILAQVTLHHCAASVGCRSLRQLVRDTQNKERRCGCAGLVLSKVLGALQSRAPNQGTASAIPGAARVWEGSAMRSREDCRSRSV